MPNWCSNTLRIIGPKSSLKKFKTKAKSKDTDLSLNKLHPQPKVLSNYVNPPRLVSKSEYLKAVEKEKKMTAKQKKDEFYSGLPMTKEIQKELIKKYGFADWYGWRVKNWGIKWDVKATLDCDDDTLLEYIFDSPWGPPTQWLEKVSKDYPKLIFRLKYDEPGMGFMGYAKAHNGKLEDKCIEESD